MEFIGIIPARYEATRFPGKPLAMINQKPMIQWVYENISKVLENVWIATDDERIFKTAESFGGKAIMTSTNHKSGTERCAEAAEVLSERYSFDIIINVQGDEPFIRPVQIELLKSCFENKTEIATLIKKIETSDELFNPNRPKVVIDNNSNALYFSRSPIPFIRGKEKSDWLAAHNYWSHVGIYAYTKEALKKITKLNPGKLEISESLEQLRWLENGLKIKTVETNYQSIGIDTPDDLKTALNYFNSRLK